MLIDPNTNMEENEEGDDVDMNTDVQANKVELNFNVS